MSTTLSCLRSLSVYRRARRGVKPRLNTHTTHNAMDRNGAGDWKEEERPSAAEVPLLMVHV